MTETQNARQKELFVPEVRQGPAPQPSVASMMQAVIERGVTADNVVALEKLCDLYERMQGKDAEQKFNAAFATLQKDMPQINATKVVRNRDGTERYRYAPYEELMEKIQPVLSANGFSLSFNTRLENNRVVSICTLGHSGGHSRTNEFAVRIGQGPPGSNEPQADMSAKSYARRGALWDALNIAADHDDDARLVGAPIDKAAASDLEARCKKAGVDIAAFLKYAGADSFESIPDASFDRLDALLTRKEKSQKQEGPW